MKSLQALTVKRPLRACEAWAASDCSGLVLAEKIKYRFPRLPDLSQDGRHESESTDASRYDVSGNTRLSALQRVFLKIKTNCKVV